MVRLGAVALKVYVEVEAKAEAVLVAVALRTFELCRVTASRVSALTCGRPSSPWTSYPEALCTNPESDHPIPSVICRMSEHSGIRQRKEVICGLVATSLDAPLGHLPGSLFYLVLS